MLFRMLLYSISLAPIYSKRLLFATTPLFVRGGKLNLVHTLTHTLDASRGVKLMGGKSEILVNPILLFFSFLHLKGIGSKLRSK
jgi:hypothetical protein